MFLQVPAFLSESEKKCRHTEGFLLDYLIRIMWMVTDNKEIKGIS